MTIRRGLRLWTGLLVVVTPLEAMSVPPTQSDPTQELLMMFARESEAHKRIVEAGNANPPALESLDEDLRGLSKVAGVPLVAERLGSGGTLVVRIDESSVLDRVASEIRAVGGRKARKSSRGGRNSSQELRVEGEREQIDEDVRRVAERLDWPLRSRAKGAETAVVVDTEALTSMAARKLAESPEVEHVERNQIMKPLSSPGSPAGAPAKATPR